MSLDDFVLIEGSNSTPEEEISTFQNIAQNFDVVPLEKIFPTYANKTILVKGQIKRIERKTMIRLASFYCSNCGFEEVVVQNLVTLTEPRYKCCSKGVWKINSDLCEMQRGLLYTLSSENSSGVCTIQLISFFDTGKKIGEYLEAIVYCTVTYDEKKKKTTEYCKSILETTSALGFALDNAIEWEEFCSTANSLINNESNVDGLINVFNDFHGSELKKIKRALIYQMISISFTEASLVKNSFRGNIHLLLTGEPGTGKSSLLERVCFLTEGRSVKGPTTSTAGLTAGLVKAQSGDWSIEAGACILSDMRILCLDEIDKCRDSSTLESLHEPMEQGTLSITKIGISMEFNTRFCSLFSMNPEKGYFQKDKTDIEQLKKVPNSILDRFDLIFTLKHREFKDEELMQGIRRTNSEILKKEEIDEWRKKIKIIKSFVTPVIPVASANYLGTFFRLLQGGKEEQQQKKEVSTILGINRRQINSLRRLSLAIAKTKMKREVDLTDCKEAISILSSTIYSNYLKKEQKTVFNLSTNEQNTLSEAKLMNKLLSFISEEKTRQEIILNMGIKNEELDYILKKLTKQGKIYSPKINYYERVYSLDD
jgi:DNA replicative helicase MCM subunit Mcm2 (Cdc46/Mcm family)